MSINVNLSLAKVRRVILIVAISIEKSWYHQKAFFWYLQMKTFGAMMQCQTRILLKLLPKAVKDRSHYLPLQIIYDRQSYNFIYIARNK